MKALQPTKTIRRLERKLKKLQERAARTRAVKRMSQRLSQAKATQRRGHERRAAEFNLEEAA